MRVSNFFQGSIAEIRHPIVANSKSWQTSFKGTGVSLFLSIISNRQAMLSQEGVQHSLEAGDHALCMWDFELSWQSRIEMEYYSRTQLYTFLTVETLDVFGPEALSFIQDVSGRSQGCQGHWNTFSNESRLLCSREMRLLFLGQWEGQLDWKLLLAECTLHYLMYCNYNCELVIIKITGKVSALRLSIR